MRQTPLHLAENIDIVHILIDNGIDVDVQVCVCVSMSVFIVVCYVFELVFVVCDFDVFSGFFTIVLRLPLITILMSITCCRGNS